MLETFQQSYLNGIIKLHNDFDKILREAVSESLKYVSNDLQYLINHPNKLYQFSSLFVDFSQEQPQNSLKGYFIFGGQKKIIHRFLSVTMEYPFFFPIVDYEYKKKSSEGIKLCDIENMLEKKQPVIISFKRIRTEKLGCSYPLYNIFHSFFGNEMLASIDDLGMPFCSFSDVKELRMETIPKFLLNRNYTLVGINHYAPYTTTDESYCVLFAQLDNSYDTHAIKVLRWFPQSRTYESSSNNCFLGDVFFEMGYISRGENAELFHFMTEKSSRILVGKKIGNKISLLGSIKIFQSMDFKFPKCLSNIVVK